MQGVSPELFCEQKKDEEKEIRQDWERHLESMYGITGDHIEKCLPNRDEVCVICKSSNPARKGSFSVEHSTVSIVEWHMLPLQ